MTRVAYINGRYTAFKDACVHVEDRGFQFADGIYEVIGLVKGRLLDLDWHLERMAHSSKEISLPLPCSMSILKYHIHELVRQNRYINGMVYVQVSRGVSPRLFPMPKDPKPSLVITVRPNDQLGFLEKYKDGVRLVTKEDPRWARPDIKTVGLLPAVLSKEEAMASGFYDTLFLKNNVVSEATSSNFWCVFGNTLKTHPKSHHILNGITKRRLQDLMKQRGMEVEEKPFTLEETYQADEAFLTSSNVLGLPVIQINDRLIGNGIAGPVTQQIQRAFIDFINKMECA